ncbi:FHA domain-containing protein [Agaribacterium haliotis]|uniref:FHA domain-containing protein n=1 Tax=Agaribacterium haliotis TaxID=2013869 RepID=UPI000BB57A86|nr:FHA domain-containing protein [Agaribacterium haliotis]
MLKLHFCDHRQADFWLTDDQYYIGRSQSDQLRIDDLSLNERHAVIQLRKGRFLLKDLASTTGTYVNGRAIKQHYLQRGDIVRMGEVELEVIDPSSTASRWTLSASNSWLIGQDYPLGDAQSERRWTIGRATDCDIVIPSKHLSRLHAVLELKNDRLFLRDLDSSNGTWVNDERILECELYAGDQIKIDVFSFQVIGPGAENKRIKTHSNNEASFDKSITAQHEIPLWQTRSTSPGNRVQEDLYKKRWSASIAALFLICCFAVWLAYLFLS